LNESANQTRGAPGLSGLILKLLKHPHSIADVFLAAAGTGTCSKMRRNGAIRYDAKKLFQKACKTWHNTVQKEMLTGCYCARL
jgi:hypothetical protein